MNEAKIKSLCWRLTLGLELLTAVLAVPTAVLFIIIAGVYSFDKSLLVILGATIALVTSYILPAIRFIRFKTLLSKTIPESFQKLSLEEKQKIKLRLLEFPKSNLGYFLIQWTFGIPFAAFVTFRFFTPTIVEALPYAILPLLIYPVLGVSHFFLTELMVSEVLITPALKDLTLKEETIPKVGIYARIFFTMSAVFSMTLTALGYLLLAQVTQFVQLQNAELTLVLMAVFITVNIFVLTSLFVKAMKFNTIQMTNRYKALASGDLRESVPIISSDELGHGSISLNSFIDSIRKITSVVIEESDRVNADSKVIATQTQGLTQAMMEQASSSEEMSAGVEEMSASIRSTAFGAKKQNDITKEAKDLVLGMESSIVSVHDIMNLTESETKQMEEETKLGQTALQSTLDAMSEIESSVDHTSNVIQVIGEISDKIGLLSLNASIEAARAGDAGRGFAVVASEISKLGEQTLSNTKRILEAVSKASSSTKSGRLAVSNTEKTFTQIGMSVHTTIDLIKQSSDMTKKQLELVKHVKESFEKLTISAMEIEHNTSEQASTSEELAKSIATITEGTEYLNQFVNDIDKLCAALSAKASNLRKTIDFFKI
ncbi:Methyl-accepting chemotaxis protein [Leptospira biflexa serovar Patoc strain 'Patoc 1 (Ames)']|uniref:Putative methyl-accepting chemotaxis protein putative membrane protein n=1 Tax=Leptospira biflexa serovar Patoc (strain Patoc 1 / ATCC 23582 / Paris) TaxID=456481 RepID=B0SQF8_LEPBP|nr:methyl-accepting chemotaxis protein [Leptospira biflexa]ABZ93970.1 Methyl-accepting chemotaxis protein [Leptospira biflexa serovar Patoc strain 'Patoc 1 (Ames)']ABZ97616.1 Putative methyl-accepting chemotaxis protein; putative membrane protein [Leptospira biflexa serovar Patoc strain 'Patoc 1 (Paris)']